MKLRASTLCIGAGQATFTDPSGAFVVVANLHTVDGTQNHSIPSSNRDSFLGTALGNVLKGCAATPALRADGIWVACGDTNMPIALAAQQLKQLRDPIAMMSSPDEKRDFIFSSAKLLKYKKRLFLARDNQHWAVAAHVTIGVLSDTSEAETGAVSAATRDLQEAAKAAAIAHVEEQREIAAAAKARTEERDRAAEMAELEEAARNDTEQQQAIIDGPGFATRLHHWQVLTSFSACVEVSEFQKCSQLCALYFGERYYVCAATPDLPQCFSSVQQRQTLHAIYTLRCNTQLPNSTSLVSKC